MSQINRDLIKWFSFLIHEAEFIFQLQLRYFVKPRHKGSVFPKYLFYFQKIVYC